MKNTNRKPLVRKKYSFFELLKVIFSKISGGKSKSELCIPGFAETIQFRSVASYQENSSAADTASQLSREQIFSAMLTNNLRGFGGAGFPMAEKLKAVLDSGHAEPVLIINSTECDPGLYHDKWILENKQKELENISGILRSVFGLSGIYLAKKKGTPPVRLEGVTVVDIPDIYPAGEENKLVSWLLGIECGENEYPAQKGVWVQNVQSLLMLHSVLSGDLPLRYITMTDLNRKHAVVVECNIDSSIEYLAREVFGKYDQLYLGGGIMQSYPATGNKTLDSRINLIAAGKTAEFSDKDCHHCGQCTRYCTADLPVEDLVAEIAKGASVPEDMKAKCSRCGACSFLCPAGKDVCSLIASA